MHSLNGRLAKLEQATLPAQKSANLKPVDMWRIVLDKLTPAWERGAFFQHPGRRMIPYLEYPTGEMAAYKLLRSAVESLGETIETPGQVKAWLDRLAQELNEYEQQNQG